MAVRKSGPHALQISSDSQYLKVSILPSQLSISPCSLRSVLLISRLQRITFVICFSKRPIADEAIRGRIGDGAYGFTSELGRIPVCLGPCERVGCAGTGTVPGDYCRLAATGPCQG